MNNLEIDKIRQLYPGLVHKQIGGKNCIVGQLKYCAVYKKSSDQILIYPTRPEEANANLIEDQYDIKIEIGDDFPETLPLVWETGGRIEAIMKKYEIKDKVALHINKNSRDSICLCPSPERLITFRDGQVNLLDFINKLVVPYFYGLSFYEKNKKWAWGEYSHGPLGVFEFYFDKMQGKDANKEMFDLTILSLATMDKRTPLAIMNGLFLRIVDKCPCGSGFAFEKCHFTGYSGVRLLEFHYKVFYSGKSIINIILDDYKASRIIKDKV